MSTRMPEGNRVADLASYRRKYHESEHRLPISRRGAIYIGILLALTVIAFAAMNNLIRSGDAADANTVKLSGRIEVRESRLGSATPALVKAVNVKEGDHVKKGQVVVSLDDRELRAKLNATGTMISAAGQAARAQRGRLSQVNSEATRLKEKNKGLLSKIFSPFTGAKKKERAIRSEMKSSYVGLQKAQIALARAQAARTQIAAKASYFRILSPIDGIVQSRNVEPGELVKAGQVLITIIDPKSAYMRGYVPEGDLGKLRIGQSTKVMLDSSKEPITGKITNIDSTPQFTPSNIYFKDDRVKQVFGVKIALNQATGSAKAGMPADAEVETDSLSRNH